MRPTPYQKKGRIGDLADVKMLEETYKRLIKIINRTEITYEWISRETGISIRTIKRWIKGKHQPHPVLYLRLKEVVDRLYEITNKEIALE